MGVPHDRLIAAEISRALDYLVTATRQLLLHCRIEARFHLHLPDPGALLARDLGAADVVPARRIARFLHVHAEVDDVSEHLHVSLRLHVTAHQAESEKRLPT